MTSSILCCLLFQIVPLGSKEGFLLDGVASSLLVLFLEVTGLVCLHWDAEGAPPSALWRPASPTYC